MLGGWAELQCRLVAGEGGGKRPTARGGRALGGRGRAQLPRRRKLREGFARRRRGAANRGAARMTKPCRGSLLAAEEGARRWVSHRRAGQARRGDYPRISANRRQARRSRHPLAANDKQREVCTDMPVRQVRRSFARGEVARGLFAFEKWRSEISGGSYHPRLPRLTADMKLPKFAAAEGYMSALPPQVAIWGISGPNMSLMACLPRADNAETAAEQTGRGVRRASAHCRSAIL